MAHSTCVIYKIVWSRNIKSKTTVKLSNNLYLSTLEPKLIMLGWIPPTYNEPLFAEPQNHSPC